MSIPNSTVESFLTQKDLAKPASVDDGPWGKILKDCQLDLATDAEISAKGIAKVDAEQGSAVVLLTWAPKKGNNILLQHEFSSERNSSYFEGAPQLDSNLKNTAYIGDGLQCMSANIRLAIRIQS